jgi:hypothetical protein
MAAGSVTDPNNPDTDGDGIPDGIEDANRNGWVDGDGEPINPLWNPWLSRIWPNGIIDPGERWEETDPNNPDTDGDGLADGWGEDVNFNGITDMALLTEEGSQVPFLISTATNAMFRYGSPTSRHVNYPVLLAAYLPVPGESGTRQTNGWPRLLILETDPLNADTDGDGLPDGWEVRHGLDPLDNGVYNFRTGMPGNPDNGPDGNPDGDYVIINGVTNAYTNLMEFQNGTSPRIFDAFNPDGIPDSTIVIGPGPSLGMINGKEYFQEFLDWTLDDLVVLDEYEGDGNNHQGGDVFPGNDGFDSSRDLVAFYVRDGGDVGQGGDGKFYFRVDMHDLQPFAEEQHLNIYVVIDTGQPQNGERVLPDEVDTITEMGWEAVVAVYDSQNGRVYVDTDPQNNSTTVGQNLLDFGVQVRDQTHAEGFVAAYFNSELDSVEFAISRNALTLPDVPGAGWNGLDVADLRFQVYTTKDGTGNSPPGAGDIGGRSDIRDSIYDDRIAEDYWRAQENFQSRITTGFGLNGFNDRGKRAKVAMVVHGNQAVQPGSVIHSRINTGDGAGYHRPVKIHEMFGAKLNLHITATLATAIHWARTNPDVAEPWRLTDIADGPAFNSLIGRLAQEGTVSLLGTTYSDHMMPYFPHEFHVDNIAQARNLLTGIYGVPPSHRVLWLPERLADSATLQEISTLGFTHTILDQMRHLLKWFGRTPALTNDGYRINRIENVDCFMINDFAGTFLFETHDGGLSMPLRQLLSKRARSGNQDQILVLMKNWEDFEDPVKADAYDRALRWMASRPWIELVSLDDVAAGNIDLSQPPDGQGNTFGRIERGTNLNLPKVAQDWIDHASRENYDRWYFGGSGPQEEGLFNRIFNVRPGANTPDPFGLMTDSGLAFHAWNDYQSITHPDLKKLAGAVLHSSVFQTAFHNQSRSNLSKFSTGAYIEPDNTNETLAAFSVISQSQIRNVSLYARVQQWLNALPASATTQQADVDRDGLDEYLLYNDRVFAVFERTGGRLTAAWVRDAGSGRVYQLIGNFVSYANTETELEGTSNIDGNSPGLVGAYRTSALKDWFASTGPGGTTQYVNNLYTASPAPSGTGWRFISSDGRIMKTIRLETAAESLTAEYQVDPIYPALFVRNGFSPNLLSLLATGQEFLSGPSLTGSRVLVENVNPAGAVAAGVTLGAGVVWNSTAVDDDPSLGVTFNTIPMRNQAQQQQIELSGTGSFSFSLDLQAGNADSDLDGIPDWYENLFDFLDPLNPDDALLDEDDDGASNFDEYIAGTDPRDAQSRPQIQRIDMSSSGLVVRFPTETGRLYRIWYRNHDLTQTPDSWTLATPQPFAGTGGIITWTDDGSLTTPHPSDPSLTLRFYKIEIEISTEP